MARGGARSRGSHRVHPVAILTPDRLARRAHAADPTDDRPRLFIAVPLAPGAVEQVAAIVAAVRADLDREARARRSEVRWVRLEGVHLTLRFLGPTDPDRVDSIAAALERAAREHHAFPAVVSGTGAFPSPSRPRTLWLGLSRGREELAGLAASLDAELERLGWSPPDRDFRPHLTLARADGRREGPRAAKLLHHRAANVAIPFSVDRVVLFESVTGGGRARYVPVREALLGT